MMVNSTFAANSARTDGGAIFFPENMLCTARQFNALEESSNSYGDVLFLHNIAGGSGGAICIGRGASIYAAFGDMIFQGNKEHVKFNSDTTFDGGDANAILFWENDKTIVISAFDNYAIRFYDPIRSSEACRVLRIHINGASSGTNNEAMTDDRLGDWATRQTGTVLFDTYISNIFFKSEYGAQVCGGTMALHNGAVFGAPENTGVFALNANAVLKIAYEQERREYVLNDDSTFSRIDPSKIIKTYPQYKSPGLNICAINAGELILNGTVHFVIPSNVQNNDILFNTTGSVVFGDLANIELSISDNGISLQKNDKIILISSTFDARTCIEGFRANFSTSAESVRRIGHETEERTSYEFNIEVDVNNLVATLTSIGEPRNVAIQQNSDEQASAGNQQTVTDEHVPIFSNSSYPAMAACQLSGFCIANHGADIASALAGIANSSFAGSDGCTLRWTPFIVPISVDRSTCKTGVNSSVKTRELSFIGGLLTDVQLSNSQLRFGQFFEFGKDNFSCSNELQPTVEISKISSRGCSQLYGAGAFMRLDFCGTSSCGGYCEGSCRIGSLSNTTHSSEMRDIPDRNADYEISNLFCGGHLAVGCTLRSHSTASVNFYGKCLWARRNCGESTVNAADTIKFSALDSVRTQIGASISCAICNSFFMRAATTFEQELDGKSSATICGNVVSASNFDRNSAIGSLQMTWKPLSTKQIAIDFALHGSIGAREGIGGYLQISYAL
jgi:predicted outer membrane repeat protein